MSPVNETGAVVSIEIEDEAWNTQPDLMAVVDAAARAALGGETGEVVVLLTGDKAVAELNQRFRGRSGPTNVLSFPAPHQPGAPGAPPLLGDLALAHGVCAREAAEQGKTLADHLSHLVVHGVLHLLGHDHVAEAEAEAMEQLERTILARLGVRDPYLSQPAP